MDNNGSFARRVIFTLLAIALIISIGTFYQIYKSNSSGSGAPNGSGLLPDGQCLSPDQGVVDCATMKPDVN